LEVLQRYYPEARLVVNQYLADIPYRKKTDDVIDALCLAVTSMIGIEDGFGTVPEAPMADRTGLLMQMVYLL
jgi:predicted RNase H-like nuclease